MPCVLAELTHDHLLSLAGETLAHVAALNPLAHEPRDAAATLPTEADRVVTWSGSLGDSLFDRSFATWMPAGRQALSDYLDAALDRCGGRTTLLLRTHARHVVSDAVAARALLAERSDPSLGLAFDPAACLEPEMLADAEDHLVRLFEIAGPLAEVVILRSLEPSADSGEPPTPVPLGAGLLEAARLGRLTREHAREDAIIAVAGPDPAGQFAAAGLA